MRTEAPVAVGRMVGGIAGAPAGVLARTFITAASAEVVTLYTGIQRSRVQAPTLDLITQSD
jgi:hypothetical protein